MAVLGVWTGSVHAQSSVDIYGNIDLGIAKKTGSTLAIGRRDNNRLGFRGVEDLGDGLKALFQLEIRYDPDVGTIEGGSRPLFQGQSRVGLQGSFGTVRFGRGLTAFQDSPVWWTRAELQPHVRTALVFFSVVVTFALLGALAAVFVPLGQWLGRWMDADPRPIRAYTANIAGSLLGIAVFVGLTAAGTPPWAWLLAAVPGLVVLAARSPEPRRARLASVALVLAVPLMAWAYRPERATLWSPYQKLSLATRADLVRFALEHRLIDVPGDDV